MYVLTCQNRGKITAGRTVGLAEWIIDDCIVLYLIFPNCNKFSKTI